MVRRKAGRDESHTGSLVSTPSIGITHQPAYGADLRLFLGDSRELIKRIPDKSIDLLCIDPPYNLAGYSTGNIKMHWRSDFNNDVAEWDQLVFSRGYL